MRAPIRSSGSSTRRMGRLRSEASPSKVAAIGQPATAPSISRQPVPELPKSRALAGSAKPPTPTPCTRHSPAPRRSTCAPSAATALAVLSTSSPSSRPLMRVSPTASAPNISARCEIDLSPGTRTRPFSGPARRAVRELRSVRMFGWRALYHERRATSHHHLYAKPCHAKPCHANAWLCSASCAARLRAGAPSLRAARCPSSVAS